MLSEGPSDLFAQQSSGMFFLDIKIIEWTNSCHDIWGCAFSAYPFILWRLLVYVYFLLASSDGKNKPLGTVKG